MNKILSAVLLLAVTGLVAAQEPTFVIHGSMKRCNDITQLDSALSKRYSAFFAGWTENDYDNAISWATSCGQYGWPASAPARVPYLQSRQEDLRRTTRPVTPGLQQGIAESSQAQAIAANARALAARLQAENAAVSANEPKLAPTPKASVHVQLRRPAASSAKPIHAPPAESKLIEHGSYTNVDGVQVHSPAHTVDGSVPAGATAECQDGSYSFSRHHRGTCSHHGGVSQWLE